MRNPLAYIGYGRLTGIGHGGVYEPPTVGSFSHVQLFVSTLAPQYRAWFFDPVVTVDVDVTVRIGFIDALGLASADGVTGAVDRRETGGQIRVTARSETNVAELAMAAGGIGEIRLAAGTHIIPGVWQMSDGGFTMNARTTGVGIGLWCQWAESIDA